MMHLTHPLAQLDSTRRKQQQFRTFVPACTGSLLALDFMGSPLTIDFGRLARELGIDPGAIARTVALLDEGNTVPFITRYRRDQTGGLDEQQITSIREVVSKLRQLEERKQTILRSIE